MSIRGVYANAVRRKFSGYFGNWEPTARIDLGDFGFVAGNVFERMGSLKALGVSWTAQPSTDGATHQKFTSSDAVKIEARAAGGAHGARASVDVSFEKKNGVFVDLAGCSYQRIDNKLSLGAQLLAEPRFDRRWAVVTDLLVARRSVIAISESGGAKLTLEADAQVPQLDLADADVGVHASHSSAIGYLVDGQRDLTPIIGLCGFRSRFFSPGTDLRVLGSAPLAAKTSTPDADEPVFLQLD
jgi:hypothetical protein